MREEYTDREVAVDAIRPLLKGVQRDPGIAQLMAQISGGRERISWCEFCALLDVVADQAKDPREIGAQVIDSALYKFQRRARLACRVLTLEDALAFMLYPRNPIDFACINSAVTHQPGRVDVVLYTADRCRPHPTFYQLVMGAAEALLPLLHLEDASVTMTAQGRQAHFVFTYTERESWRSRMRRFFSHKLFSMYSIAIIRSSYPYLVQGRKMFEEQLIERAKIETQLRDSDQAFERRLREIDDVIAEFDETGQLVYLSPNLEPLIGLSADEARAHPEAVINSEDLARVSEEARLALEQKVPVRIDDFRILSADRSSRWVEAVFNPFTTNAGVKHTICVLRDVTERRRFYEERKRIDRQLEHTQRLEALGVLAGGIAHDFNNLLTPIIGQAELASLGVDQPEELTERLSTIRTAADKASDLIRQLMVYAGREPASFAVFDLSKEVDELLPLIKTSIPANSEFSVSLAPDALVNGDVAQIRQIIMNLLINAAEAIGSAAGEIELTIEVTDVVILRVEDNGCGMDDETRTRAFDPFYTTKFAGRGLGLSAVLGIVHAHDGELVVDSEPGRGTRIEVTLARASEQVASVSMPEDAVYQGSGLILLVDDEVAVRDVGRAMLESLGYAVDVAADGAEALAMFAANDYSALVVDLVMPKADGREVLAAVRQRSPRLPVVLVSGYGALVHPESDIDTYTRFLSKPFRVAQLGATLHELTTLQEPGPQAALAP